MKSLLSFLALALGTAFVAWGQEAVDLSVSAYTVGQEQSGRMTAVGASAALQQHCRRQVAAMSPRGGVDLQWQRDELIERPGMGWQYLTYWQQGSARLVASFDALLRHGELQVLEVGSYQLCRCENCSEVAFAPDGPGCACEAGDGCTFLVGETLH